MSTNSNENTDSSAFVLKTLDTLIGRTRGQIVRDPAVIKIGTNGSTNTQESDEPKISKPHRKIDPDTVDTKKEESEHTLSFKPHIPKSCDECECTSHKNPA